MNNTIYIIRDTDMNFIVNVCATFTKVMDKVMETMDECGYSSFNFVNADDVYFITFPHCDPDCVGHWRVERWEVEG